MSKTRGISMTVGMVAMLFLFFFVSDWYNRYFNDAVKLKPKMYCYETYRGTLNSAFYVKKESLIDSLVQYYRKIEGGMHPNPTFNFPPLTLPTDTCVYVMGYNADSTAADIICYYKWSRKVTYERVYVYVNTLHTKPPGEVQLSKWKRSHGRTN